MAARFIACFVILGVRLAFPKAQLGSHVTWIGMDIGLEGFEITVIVPQEKLDSILA